MKPTSLLPLLGLAVTLALSPCRAALLDGQAWLDHVRQDLAPFWYQAADGIQDGAYASFLCNDASRPDPKALLAKPSPATLCSELANPPDWIAQGLPYQWTRMVSRQSYAYAMLFHLTGDPQALALARQGVDFLRTRALLPHDPHLRGQDGAITRFQDGQAADHPDERTSQDLAYIGLGLAAWYYLSGDEDVLADLQRLQDHLFTAYLDQPHQRLTWYPARRTQDQQVELVAQLDQLNAYLVLLAPWLHGQQQALWHERMAWLAQALVRDFYTPAEGRFYGYLHDDSGLLPSARHADFGHSSKSFWMLYLTGRQLSDPLLTKLAEGGLYQLLSRAYRQDQLKNLPVPLPEGADGSQQVGWWGDRDGENGSAWWEYAELDQAAATLGLANAAPRRYLYHTWPSWFATFVDKQHGEVWGWINDAGSLKAHLWKNGYHSLEHALIGYLTAQAFQAKPVTLYFARPLPVGQTVPVYYYRAKVLTCQRVAGQDGIWQLTLSPPQLP